jgi:hypothetical protein
MREDNTMNTKTMRVTLAAILMGGIAQAQTNSVDWSWTFKWGGDTCGLLFENTNLTASVKAAIRDEVSKVYASVSTNNLYTKIYTPSDPKYGIFVGFVGLQDDFGGPAELGGWKYILHNGNKYFHVQEKVSAKYLEQIALTNKYKVAVGSLSNFLATVNSTFADSENPADYVKLWWSMEQGKVLSLTGTEPQKHIEIFCEEFNEYEVIVPSILNFKQDAEIYGGVFYCKTVFRKRDDGTYEHGFPDIAFCKEKWYLVLPEF